MDVPRRGGERTGVPGLVKAYVGDPAQAGDDYVASEAASEPVGEDVVAGVEPEVPRA